MIYSDWVVSLKNIHLGRIMWMYCPGHAGVKGNVQADRLAGAADVKQGLTLGTSEVL